MEPFRVVESDEERTKRLLKEYLERTKLPEDPDNWVYRGSRCFRKLENGLLVPVAIL